MVTRRKTHPAQPSRRTPTSGRKSRRAQVGGAATSPERRMPPVLVRKSGYDAASGKPAKTRRPRRRFDIALSSPGVEVRLPALPAVQLGWRLLSFALLAGLLALLYHLLTSPLYKVQAAELQDAQRLSAQQINATLNLYNRSIFEIAPPEIEATLRAAYPELIDVQIQIGLPAAVYITVQERTPLIAWHQDGQTLWIDQAGVAFPPRTAVDGLVDVQAHAAPPAPLVVEMQEQGVAAEAEARIETGVSTTPAVFIKPELVAVIQELVLQKPAESVLVFDPQHGLGWFDPRGWDVYFGMDTDDMAMKLTVYQAIAQDLQGRGITPALINVEFVHAPYYRMER